MGNCLLAYPDKTLSAASVSGGSWPLPLLNLQRPETWLKARSGSLDLADTQFTIDLGISTDLRVIALVGYNASRSALVRIRCADNPDMTGPVYDSGWAPFFFTFYPQGGLPWGHPDLWTGGACPDISTFWRTRYFVLTGEYSIQARYVMVEIDDRANPAGFFELSRCYAAPAWQPGVNMQYGAEFGLVSATQVDRSKSGAPFYERYQMRRSCKFTLDLPLAQSLSFPWYMQSQLDISGEIFFVCDPDDATMIECSRSFLCNMQELSPLQYPYFDTNTTAFNLLEVL